MTVAADAANAVSVDVISVAISVADAAATDATGVNAATRLVNKKQV